MRKRGYLVGIFVIMSLGLAACGASLETVTPVPILKATATASESEIASPTVIPIVTQTLASPTSARTSATASTLFAASPSPTATALSSPATVISPTASSTQAVTTPGLAPNVVIASTPTPEYRSAARVASPALPVTATPALNPTTLPLTKNGPDSEEQNFLQQLNIFRQANGRGTLAFDPLLYNSARWMAQDMASKNYVAHTDSQGRDIAKRIKAFGYPGNWVGENIAGGFERAEDNLKIWQSDDIHKNNLLGANYTKVGIGRYYQQGSLNGWYWVLDLG